MTWPRLLTCGLVLAFLGGGAGIDADSTQGSMQLSVQVVRSCRVQTTREGAAVDCGRSRAPGVRITEDRQPVPTRTIQSGPNQSTILAINF
jgi:hypothetical protein